MKHCLQNITLMLSFLASFSSKAQHKCATAIKHAEILQKNVLAKENNLKLERFTQKFVSLKANNRQEAAPEVVYIPVVVHVVYNTPEQNISDAQITSQIEILNNDFEGKNADSTQIPAAFKPLFGKTNIKFVLANRDPNGNVTTGITRTPTTVTAFDSNTEFVKKDADGGKTAWDVTKYMNLWVCSIDGTTLGYATLPGDLASNGALDGIVIRYNAFGISQINDGDNTKGRTATHEVGHWLNLAHIWGEGNAVCGDDNVSDTPPQAAANESNCPTFPHKANTSCTPGANGEMFMNYMDYVNDDCMVMFSAGQATRMYAALNADRASIKTSTGYVLSASSTTGNNNSVLSANISTSVSPNPSSGLFIFNSSNYSLATVSVSTVFGEVIKNISSANFPFTLDLTNFSDGVYFVKIVQNRKSELISLPSKASK